MCVQFGGTDIVFPTRVGVNRPMNPGWARGISFPHPRGGEPL